MTDNMEIEVTNSSIDINKPILKTSDVSGNILYITKGVEANESRYLQRAIRQNVSIRHNINKTIYNELLPHYFPENYELLSELKSFIELLPEGPVQEEVPVVALPGSPTPLASASVEMDVETTKEKKTVTVSSPTPTSTLPSLNPITILPEVEAYFLYLIVSSLLRENFIFEAYEFSLIAVQRIKQFNRRTLDYLNAKIYFYLGLAYDKVNVEVNHKNNQEIIQKLSAKSFLSISNDQFLSILMKGYQTACVRHDQFSQAVLLNLILKNHLDHNMIEKAYNFSLRSIFPEEIISKSNNQYSRYLYYLGFVYAIQLEYSDAYQRLNMSLRKAPQSEYGENFTLNIKKLLILVQLLMGDIPEKVLFSKDKKASNEDTENTVAERELNLKLYPYYKLTQAVRNGDVASYRNILATYSDVFKHDKLYSLVQRLGHNVLKIGLRKITLSYSHISLDDIAKKLYLDSASTAEVICSKAIKDGVIDAKINPEAGSLVSYETNDLYSTEEPQKNFNKRIKFCLSIHNEVVKSMRYPPEKEFKQEEPVNEEDPTNFEDLIADFDED